MITLKGFGSPQHGKKGMNYSSKRSEAVGGGDDAAKQRDSWFSRANHTSFRSVNSFPGIALERKQ